MGTCRYCERSGKTISDVIGFCADCIRSHFSEVWPEIAKVHARSRKAYSLPVEPPRDPQGVSCDICFNRCRIPEGRSGFCGLRHVRDGKLKGGRPHEGNLSFYHDPLPPNCVAGFVCPGGTGCGYPRYAHVKGPEYGYKNLAVFYQACSFDCLFCQNWHYRYSAVRESQVDALELAEAVDDRTACICYFGGDPTPQLPHAIRASRLALDKNKGRILRICWETNGSMHPALLRQAAELSFNSGGCIKFDLKTWSEELHIALCGVSNKRTLENFELLAEYARRRSVPPFLTASSLLIPGYIDREEISRIAAFISSLSPDIPYALLAFHPQFIMGDLPPTSRRHAEECLAEAKGQGLKRVRLGNIHLLGSDY